MTIVRHSSQVPPYDGRHAFLATLAGPPWIQFGHSVLGRPLVYAVREPPSGGPAAATVLIAGAIHGDEPASGVLAARFFTELSRTDLPSDPSVSQSEPTAPRVRVVVVPVVNPDGFAASAKDNAHDVDLNRNFPTRNHGERRRAGYEPGSAPGSEPGSEPETAALVALIARESASWLIAIHQPLECVNYDGPATAWAEWVAAATGLPARADIGYPTPGSMGTYYGVERQVPILTLELSGAAPEDQWALAHAALMAALTGAAR